MIKRVLTLILCGIMLLCLAACGENDVVETDDTSGNTYQSEADNTQQTNSVFNTANIARITFYAHYGQGKGSDVPSENMTEIINWLGSFTIGEKADEMLPPGTNTIYVEIEYSDGTVVKNGIDTATVGGIAYYINRDAAPECYQDILSETSLG